MEHRIQQLELRLAEQERANAGQRDDIKEQQQVIAGLRSDMKEHERVNTELRGDMMSLKVILDGDRKESQAGFEHQDQKKKKLFGLLGQAKESLGEVKGTVAALQGYQEHFAAKVELQYVHIILYHQAMLTFARTLSKQLDDLKYERAGSCFMGT